MTREKKLNFVNTVIATNGRQPYTNFWAKRVKQSASTLITAKKMQNQGGLLKRRVPKIYLYIQFRTS